MALSVPWKIKSCSMTHLISFHRLMFGFINTHVGLDNNSNLVALLMKHVILIISLSMCCYGRILNTTLFESWEIVGPYPSWWVFNLLLILLQLLHSFWSYLIVKTACRAISKGKVSHYNQLFFSSKVFLNNGMFLPLAHI